MLLSRAITGTHRPPTPKPPKPGDDPRTVLALKKDRDSNPGRSHAVGGR